MKGIVCCLLFLAVLVPSIHAQNDTLKVTQDESSMEQAIARFLKANYAVETREKTVKNGDIALLVKMEGKNGPDFDVAVDTQCSNRDQSGTVIERLVSVQVFTNVKVPAHKRAAVLESINKFVAENYFSSFYLDDDGELVAQWSLNVMKEGLRTEYVADSIIRLAESWRNLRQLAEKALGGN